MNMWEPRRIAGAAGLVLAAMLVVAFVLDFVITGTTGGPPTIALSSLTADLTRARDSVIWPIETWLYSLQIVPFAIFILGVRSAFRGSQSEWLANASMVAAMLFMALHTLHNLAILTVVQVMAPTYVPGATDAPAIEAVSRGLLGLAYAAFVPGGGVGGMFFVLTCAGFAIAQRRTRALPPWTGPLAATSAVLTAIAFAQYIVPPVFVVALVGWLAFIAWVVIASVDLFRSAPRAGPALSSQPA